MDLHQFHHPNTTATTAPPPNPTPNRAEAERLLGIAEKLLLNRDLTGSREFALLAQETEPLLEGSDQILAITDVLIASETRVANNRHHDWYSILQTSPQLASDSDLLKKNYRRLALLLHPDKNRYPLADSAFKLVADAWATLSNSSKKGLYDHELNVYSKVELRATAGGGGNNDKTSNPNINTNTDKLPVRRNPRDESNNNSATPQKRGGGGAGVGSGKGNQSGGGNTKMTPNFWTACPYCYVLYEYPRSYEECCIRCPNCERAFHATVLNSLPPMVPGKEAYYCCWGFFPLGFSLEGNGNGGSKGKNKKKVDDGGNNQDDEGNNNNPNGNANHNNNDTNNANNNNNQGSVFPNWMPAGMFGSPMGGGGANMNMNASAAAVDISDGSASAGFGNTNASFGANVGRGMPKKRGRPRKNPMAV